VDGILNKMLSKLEVGVLHQEKENSQKYKLVTHHHSENIVVINGQLQEEELYHVLVNQLEEDQQDLPFHLNINQLLSIMLGLMF